MFSPLYIISPAWEILEKFKVVNIFDVGKYGLSGIFLFLDGLVYWFVSQLFAIFEGLAGMQIISQDTYQVVVNRFYVIIGIVMLFYLAYSLLKTMINPDDFNKSVGKIATNSIISLILVGMVPLLFSYVFQIQEAVINDHIIDTLILGKEKVAEYEGQQIGFVTKYGNSAALNVLNTFLNPDNLPMEGLSSLTWEEFKKGVVAGESSGFLKITDFAEPVHEGEVDYIPIIGTICGIFLAYVLVSFSLDLGIRVVKLAFYEIIAPIPILMRIIPEKKSVFDNWLKGVVNAFMEVFIRLFIMYLVVFIVSAIVEGEIDLVHSEVGLLGNAIVILGLFAFAKQAPKLLCDVMGIDSGKIKLGIRDKLVASGALGIASMFGGGIKTGVNNLTNGALKTVGANGKLNMLKEGLKTPFSTVGGFISGAARSAKAGFSAKTYADVKKAASQGADASLRSRDEREAYRANHGNNMAGVTIGHVQDFARKFSQFSGLRAGLEVLKKEQSKVNEVKDARKAINDRLEAILTRDKNKLTSRTRFDVAGVTAPGAGFNNYADLLNEMEIMKSTGKTSAGANVTASMLTQMAAAEFEMKEAMKKDILAGYDLANKNNPNAKIKEEDFSTKYDAQLQSLVTDFRTKSFQNAKAIADYADTANSAINASLNNFMKQAINNSNQKIYDFVSSDNVRDMFDKASNEAIKSASRTIDSEVAKKYQEESKNKS